jgi:hypothetical protein
LFTATQKDDEVHETDVHPSPANTGVVQRVPVNVDKPATSPAHAQKVDDAHDTSDSPCVSACGAWRSCAQELPFHVHIELWAFVALQNEAEVQDTEVIASPECRPVDQVPPMRSSASPPASTAAQKEVAGHDTDENALVVTELEAPQCTADSRT